MRSYCNFLISNFFYIITFICIILFPTWLSIIFGIGMFVIYPLYGIIVLKLHITKSSAKYLYDDDTGKITKIATTEITRNMTIKEKNGNRKYDINIIYHPKIKIN